MSNTFFTKAQFSDNFGKEMASAASVYERRKRDGLADYSLASYDFVFVSDGKLKLDKLGKLLTENFEYKINKVTQVNNHWELTGDASEFPVDEHNLMYWALGLYCKGYEFDCLFDGYGAVGDPQNQFFPKLDKDLENQYFEMAMQAYNKGNLGTAVIHFSTVIKINPSDPNAWYSRAAVKDQLYTSKAARRDYDKAIELAPDFTDAIINRAANKDEAGEHQEAIKDYDFVIAREPENGMAYFNRGNSKFSLNNSKGACEDWHKAKELGHTDVQYRIDNHCKPKTIEQKVKDLFKW